MCEGKDRWSILEPRDRLYAAEMTQVLPFGFTGRKDTVARRLSALFTHSKQELVYSQQYRL